MRGTYRRLLAALGFLLIGAAAEAAEPQKDSIVILTGAKTLTHYRSDGTVKEYRVGVGREGFRWWGVKYIDRMAEWPDWHPTPEMRQRDPKLPAKVKGGPHNPLGARALYLKGTLYRIHGSNDIDSVGDAASAGCFRLSNEDVIDLYARVTLGTKVVVLP